jgi:molybdopterin molybdotransferase
LNSVSQAQEIILAHVQRQGIESVPISQALGRVLAEDVSSNRNHPPYDVSAMDGYAIRRADTVGATKENPVVLKVVDDIRAGSAPACAVGAGQASMIMTGAPVPEGADAVIRVEDTSRRSHKGMHSKQEHGPDVDIWAESRPSDNIRPMGENLKLGDTVARIDDVIRPAEVGILAMVKKAQVEVFCQPTVAILSNGDELEDIDEPFDANKIPNANSYTVMAQLQAIGIKPVILGIARDTREQLEEKLREGLKYDVLIISGGVSVGHHDFVRPTLKDMGITMHFWRIAMRPGHPMAFGTTAKTAVFALPGNPVASMVCTEEFVVPAMRKIMGFEKLFRPTVEAVVGGSVKDKEGRMHFMRATLEKNAEGVNVVTSVGSQGSGILMSMVNADALMVVPASRAGLSEGETVRVQLLFGSDFQQQPDLEINLYNS